MTIYVSINYLMSEYYSLFPYFCNKDQFLLSFYIFYFYFYRINHGCYPDGREENNITENNVIGACLINYVIMLVYRFSLLTWQSSCISRLGLEKHLKSICPSPQSHCFEAHRV